MNPSSRRTSNTHVRSEDKAIVIASLVELVKAGYGTLEEIPDMKSQLLHLWSGEVYWLGTHEIMRIR